MLKGSKIVYHGSNVVVDRANILNTIHYKDFGKGFYVTKIKNQAIKWAKRKGNNSCGILNKYILDANYRNCNYLHFDGITDDWIDFIAYCRLGKQHKYDIVEGPMADDVIWDYVTDYIEGRIPREVFKSYCDFRKPTHQIVFHNKNILDKYLKYVGYERV